jgi:ABC-type multidrug transport system fused ATPase/permease subunit
LTVAVLLFANIGLQLINPQILRYFIDEAQAGSPLNRLITAAVLFTAVALVQQVTNVVATYTSGKVGWTATNALRADLARHCLFLDMSFHNNHTTGEMIERIDGDANQLGGFFSTFVIQVLGSAILLVGILALLFREDWRAGLVLTGFALLTLFILARLRNVTVAHWKATRQASADTFGFLEERLSGREDIRTSAAKPYVMRRFYEYMRNWFRRELKASFMTSLVLNSTWLSFGVGNAVALGVGAYLFMNDIVTIGTVYLIFHYTVMLAQPIERFTQQLDDLQKATASIVRILELLQTKQTVVDGSGVSFPEGAQSVKFDDVSFSYNQDDTVLHNVDFEIQPGRILGLLGRTGSGKTTMTRLLFRLYDPDEGP